MYGKVIEDTEELCPEGEELWAKHLDKVRNGSGCGGYQAYLNHIWNCKVCQKALELTSLEVEFQKAHYWKKKKERSE